MTTTTEIRTMNRENQEAAQALACDLRERIIEIERLVGKTIHQVNSEKSLLDTKVRPWEIELKAVKSMLGVLSDQLIRLEMTIQWLHKTEGADELIRRALEHQREEFDNARKDDTDRPGILDGCGSVK